MDLYEYVVYLKPGSDGEPPLLVTLRPELLFAPSADAARKLATLRAAGPLT